MRDYINAESDYFEPPPNRVPYPRGVVLRSYGGSGVINTRGVDFEVTEHYVQLMPVTSQRQPSLRCFVQLPADRTTLRAIANKLREIALALESESPEGPAEPGSVAQ
jgi:hypothetical protein